MSSKVLTIDDEAELSEVAELFESKNIKRAPVLNAAGQLVGIVSRANFVHAIANASRPRTDPSDVNDDDITAALTKELATHAWWRGGANSVTVSNGVVHFWGYYSTPDELDAARVAAENIPGVERVEEHRNRYPIAYA
jgi:osmotically-inducible protein OsmY